MYHHHSLYLSSSVTMFVRCRCCYSQWLLLYAIWTFGGFQKHKIISKKWIEKRTRMSIVWFYPLDAACPTLSLSSAVIQHFVNRINHYLTSSHPSIVSLLILRAKVERCSSQLMLPCLSLEILLHSCSSSTTQCSSMYKPTPSCCTLLDASHWCSLEPKLCWYISVPRSRYGPSETMLHCCNLKEIYLSCRWTTNWTRSSVTLWYWILDIGKVGIK